ncbi:MAG: mechanosensitive ion channel family protein [Chloroflexota bacterium]
MDFGALTSQFHQIDWAPATSIAVILVTTAVALWLLQVAVRGVSRMVLQRDREPARELAQKAKTLSQVVETTGRIAIFTIAGLSLISLLWQDVTPLLASAGIAGLAIGFGAQNLVKDWLGGFFILLENQYSVDDVIKVGEYAGSVEKLDLRRTVLRTLDGSIVVIPNGEVRTVTNLTKEWSRVVMDVGISYDADIDGALGVLRRVGEELAADEEVGKLLLEPPEVLGVEALGQYQVTLRMLVKTLPSKQWTVARALRVRVKKAFDREGIEIPYPHQVNVVKAPFGKAMDGGLATLVGQREMSE